MVLDINFDTVKVLGKFSLIALGLLFVVFLVAVITPWLARKIDGIRNNPERVKKSNYDFDKDEVKSIYEAQDTQDKENLDGKK